MGSLGVLSTQLQTCRHTQTNVSLSPRSPVSTVNQRTPQSVGVMFGDKMAATVTPCSVIYQLRKTHSFCRQSAAAVARQHLSGSHGDSEQRCFHSWRNERGRTSPLLLLSSCFLFSSSPPASLFLSPLLFISRVCSFPLSFAPILLQFLISSFVFSSLQTFTCH